LIYFVFAFFEVYLVCAFSYVLFASISQVIGCGDRLRNDLYIVSVGALNSTPNSPKQERQVPH